MINDEFDNIRKTCYIMIIELLMAILLLFMGVYAVDISVARNDYLRLSQHKEQKQVIENCLFTSVCKRYNKLLNGENDD